MQPTTDPEPGEMPTPEPSDPSTDNPVEAPVLPQILLNDCAGIATLNYFPPGLLAAVPPASWEASQVPLLKVRIEARQCARVAVGPYERGPITVLFETHDNRTAPEACVADGDFLVDEILHRVWVDDADIAQWLEATYGLPVGLAGPLTPSTDVGGQLTGWQVAVEGAVTILHAEPTGSGESTIRDTYRYFWAHPDGGVGQLDLASELHVAGGGMPLVTGEVHEPFLASIVGSPYVGYGELFAGSSSEGTFRVHGDARCDG